MSKKRAAVVIGVNRPGGTFTPLRSPAEGAINLGIWLGKQGFDPVKVFTDKGGRYPPRDIGAFIKTIVDIQSYDQLLIYFSGHGLWKNRNEFWLLSGAPQDADAAISLEESASLAKDCGIASVILISDACRSLPKTKQQESVRGSVIFPNEEIQRQYRPKIDRFLAAVETDPAYEIPIDGKVESVFTYCLRQAYRNPDAGMVRKITEDGTEISIVPNSKLETYLRRRIAEVFASANLRLEQTPDIAVLSGDEVYIGRLEPEPAISASPEPSGLAPPPGRLVGWIESLQSLLPGFGPSDLHAPPSFTATPPAPRAHISEVADVALAKALGLDPAVAADRLAQIESLSKSSGFDQALTTEGRVPDVTHFETETGFTVAGAIVDSVRVTKGGAFEVLNNGAQGSGAVIRYTPPQERPWMPGTVVLRFADGTGTALAALPGYICHVLVQAGGVGGVNYVPSTTSHRWGEYQRKQADIERLRAAATAAAQFGVFWIPDKRSAELLAEGIRTEKALDPSLGLYAAYAYYDASRDEQIRSVMDFMGRDIQGRLFDVALLAGQFRRRETSSQPPIAPFCPMLTQGWNLLRSSGAELPKVLYDAQDDLVPALWTTFQPRRAELILDAMDNGILT